MANVIKYSTSNPSRPGLRRGNTVIGTGIENYGPTSVTGYVSGIEVPVGGYVVYSLHNNNPTAYVAYNDNDLIPIARTLGNTVETVEASKRFLAGNANTWILDDNPRDIVTDDVRLNLDVSVLSSYPRSGDTFYDLSGYNNNFPLNEVQFQNGELVFDGTDSYAQASISSYNPDSAPSTMIVTFKAMDLGAGEQAIFSDNYGPEFGIWIHSNGDLRFVAYASVYATITDARYYHAVLTVTPGALKNNPNPTYVQGYLNGELVGESQASTGNGMNDQPFTLGVDYKSGNFGNYFNGSIASAQIYYSKLTQLQILQNYYGGPIVTEGLIRALDFSNLVCFESGNSQGYDLTGNDTFDLFNTPTVVRDFGGGISCNDTDEFIALTDKTPTDYVTVEVWYTRDSASSGEDIVFNKEDCWEIRDDGGNILWAVKANNQNWFWYDSTANIAVGETIQFVLTYDGNYVKSYKNGELVQTYTYPSGGVLNNQNGCYPKLNSRSCTRTSIHNPGNHTFYQFRIYDRSLTDKEVMQNYNAYSSIFI